MRPIKPDQPGSSIAPAASREEERLREENQDLKRQLQKLKGPGGLPPGLQTAVWHPSGITIWSIVLAVSVLLVVAFFAGYIPLHKRQALILHEALEQERALPRVEVIHVGRSSNRSELELPGSIQAITEAPILARADGYIQRRLVDIGDRVQAGQPLAEIDAPQTDEQVRQAKAVLQRAQAVVDLTLAN